MFASTTLAPGLGLSLAPYPRSCQMGLEPLSEAPLCALQPLAPSFLVVLAEAACLWRLLDLSIVLPWPYDSRATCLALPPVSGLSFVLGEFSFWLGFGLCLTFLLVPWGCRCAYCGPHCGRESARVLASLLGPSLQGYDTYLAFVPQLEALSESLTHSIPRSFLVVSLSAYAVGLADALWLCPERALRLFFASVSLVDPVTLSPLSSSVFADGFRHL